MFVADVCINRSKLGLQVKLTNEQRAMLEAAVYRRGHIIILQILTPHKEKTTGTTDSLHKQRLVVTSA